MAAQRKGWAFGERIPETSPYLTILGSYYTRPEAPPRRSVRLRPRRRLTSQYSNPYMKLEVRHVTEMGRTVFRITGL